MKRHDTISSNKVLIALIAANVLVWTARCGAAPKDSVAMIRSDLGQCSAVSIGNGLMLSVGHCKGMKFVNVSGKNYDCEEIRRGDSGVDPAILLKLKYTGTVPSSRLAENPPVAGDRVFSWGWPRGKLTRREGKVVRVASVSKGGGPQQRMLITDFRTDFGHSGGPLFNTAGEVVGLLSMTWPHPDTPPSVAGGSAWVHLSDLHALATPTKAKETLYVFTLPGCRPCREFKRDYDAGKFDNKYDVRFIDVGTKDGLAKYHKLRAELEKVTGKKQPDGVPAFWLRGRAGMIAGYGPGRMRGLDRILGWLKSTIKLPLVIPDILASLLGRDRSCPVPEPDGKSTIPPPDKSPVPDPTPNQPAEEDGGGIPWAALLSLIGGGLVGLIEKRRGA